MTSKSLTTFVSLMVAFSLVACGGGDGKTDPGLEEDVPGDVLPDTPPEDPGEADEGVAQDPGQPDPGVDTNDPGTVEDPGTTDDVEPTDAADVTEDPGTQADVVEPICPCTVEDFWYCGTDGQDYQGARCAQCAICAPGPSCVGCTGSVNCGESTDDFILRKGKCSECLDCDLQDECERLSFVTCGKICAEVDGVEASYPDLCVLKTASGCSDDYDTLIVNYGDCQRPPCDPCLGQAYNPVCGSNNKTYWNNCEFNNASTCFGDTGVTRACLGACTTDSCTVCPNTCDPVCGDDNVTYMNACAATTCGTKGKLVAYNGACCPECDAQPTNQVCTTAGNLYRNSCYAACHGETLCSATGDAVCGNDGKDYVNACEANCRAGGVLHDGPCVGICEQCPRTLNPVCGVDDRGNFRSYQNDCFKTCLGGTGGTAGACLTGCQDICGSLSTPNPWTPSGQVCAADGFTYPTACFPEKCFGGLSYVAGACP